MVEDKNWFTRVRERAYEHFLRRQGRPNGGALGDWLNAENEIRIQAASPDYTGQGKAGDETRWVSSTGMATTLKILPNARERRYEQELEENLLHRWCGASRR